MAKRECAFCPSTAKMSGEHLWSEWMGKLLPGGKRLSMLGPNREIINTRVSRTIDIKLKVVCKSCNEKWMSNIENLHAKPAMADLILGKTNIPIDQKRANSIALFMFKTSVILDYLRRGGEPFFSREARHEFRVSHRIPPNVRMWLNAFAPAGRGEANTLYHRADLPNGSSLEIYVCTFGIQHLILQSVAAHALGLSQLARKDKFLAVPIWPTVVPNFVWPPNEAVMSIEEFDAFSSGWNTLNVS